MQLIDACEDDCVWNSENSTYKEFWCLRTEDKETDPSYL